MQELQSEENTHREWLINDKTNRAFIFSMICHENDSSAEI